MKRARRLLSCCLVAGLGAVACSDGPADDDDDVVGDDADAAPVPVVDDPVVPLPPPDPSEGFQLKIEAIAPAGEEIWKCLVQYSFPDESTTGTLIHFSGGESRQNEGVHHMDLASLAFVDASQVTDFPGPGVHDCDTAIYVGTQSEALMQDLVVFYGTQLAEDEIQLPAGVSVTLPRGSASLFEVHYVNTSDTDVMVRSYLNVYTRQPEEVVDTIWVDVPRDRGIAIPARSNDYVEWTRCTMKYATDILFMSSHTHELGHDFQIRQFDGVNPPVDADAMVYRNEQWDVPHLEAFDPPIHVEAGQGFEWRCVYDNPGSAEVNWGFATTDEMCQIVLVFVDDPALGLLDKNECEIVDSSNGTDPPL